jgi:hypothetical protein
MHLRRLIKANIPFPDKPPIIGKGEKEDGCDREQPRISLRRKKNKKPAVELSNHGVESHQPQCHYGNSEVSTPKSQRLTSSSQKYPLGGF